MAQRKVGDVTDISAKTDLILPVSSAIQKEIEQKQKFLKEEQEKIDRYNEEITNIDPVFETLSFKNGLIVVRLYKNAFAKKTPGLNKGEDYWVNCMHEIEIETPGAQRILVRNPLDYRLEGVVVACDEAITERDSQIKPGTKISVSRRVQMNDIFYLDKTKVDRPPTAEELTHNQDATKNFFPNHEGYFLINYTMIDYVLS